MFSYVLVFAGYMAMDPKGVNLIKDYLIETLPRWPQHNLYLKPMVTKGEMWRKDKIWIDIKDLTFFIINMQYNIAAFQEIIAHKYTENTLKEKLKVWPCIIV